MNMHRLRSLVLSLVAVLLLVPAYVTVNDAQEQMVTYQLVVLDRGPGRPAQIPPGGDDLHKQHLAYFTSLQADGRALVVGPFGDDGPARGVIVMRQSSRDEARAIVEADPGVKAGRLLVTVMDLWSPPDVFQRPPRPDDVEQLYFGFLKSGPNRTQDAETAKRLQAEHLAHMADQHEQGKLVAAGPIGEGGGDRRGIVVYRVPSIEEARTRAEGDPAVKAGRLVIELHPWTVPKGVFR